jgi:hypothetical protein
MPLYRSRDCTEAKIELYLGGWGGRGGAMWRGWQEICLIEIISNRRVRHLRFLPLD